MAQTVPDRAPDRVESDGILRFFGITVVGLGVILTAVIGLISGPRPGERLVPRYYWAAFLGLPIIAVGSALMESCAISAQLHAVSLEKWFSSRGTTSTV